MRIALTIDTEHPDRPCSGRADPLVVQALEEAGARATFFLQGRWTQANPSLARRIAAGGHLIGNHTMSHSRVPHLTDDGIRSSLREAESAIEEATGVDPRPWLRLPHGAGEDDERVLGVVSGLDYRVVGWDVDPEDWSGASTAEELTDLVVNGCRDHGDGAVVLLHVWPDATAAA